METQNEKTSNKVEPFVGCGGGLYRTAGVEREPAVLEGGPAHGRVDNYANVHRVEIEMEDEDGEIRCYWYGLTDLKDEEGRRIFRYRWTPQFGPVNH